MSAHAGTPRPAIAIRWHIDWEPSNADSVRRRARAVHRSRRRRHHGRDRARRSSRPPAAPPTRASSRTIARCSNSAWSAQTMHQVDERTPIGDLVHAHRGVPDNPRTVFPVSREVARAPSCDTMGRLSRGGAMSRTMGAPGRSARCPYPRSSIGRKKRPCGRDHRLRGSGRPTGSRRLAGSVGVARSHRLSGTPLTTIVPRLPAARRRDRARAQPNA